MSQTKSLGFCCLLAVSGTLLSGCSTNSTNSAAQSTEYSAEELSARNEALLAREHEVARKEAELSSRMTGMQNNAAATGSGGSSSLLPPGANAGECYARVWVEPEYDTVTEQVLISEGSSRIEIQPAVYQTVTEQVQISPASTRLEMVPARYETVTEKQLVEKGGRYWRVKPDVSSAPAGQHMLDAASSDGIDLAAAEPGDCFREYYVPAKFEQVEEQVLVREAYDDITTKEPEYHWIDKKVLVSEASSRIEEVPAVYETFDDRVVDVPAHTMWKKGSGPIQKIDEATGEIMCLVDVPATYKVVSKRVLKSAATTRVIDIPAVYETVRVKELVNNAVATRNTVPAEYKAVVTTQQVSEPGLMWSDVQDLSVSKENRTGNQVCLVEKQPVYQSVEVTRIVEPAKTVEIAVPAQYETVKVEKLASAATTNEIPIPAEYDTVELRRQSEPGYMEWRSILCETNMNNDTIRGIQQALDDRGYNPGKIDGVIGRNTMKAVNAFQRDNELPVDDYLNLRTVEALNVSY